MSALCVQSYARCVQIQGATDYWRARLRVQLRKLDNGGRIRCAIYTRKSTDEGLDREFNFS
jgi:hypothetical protein